MLSILHLQSCSAAAHKSQSQRENTGSDLRTPPLLCMDMRDTQYDPFPDPFFQESSVLEIPVVAITPDPLSLIATDGPVFSEFV